MCSRNGKLPSENSREGVKGTGVGGHRGCKNFVDCGGGKGLQSEITFPERRIDTFDDFRMFPRKFSLRFLGSTRFRWLVHTAAPFFVRRGWI